MSESSRSSGETAAWSGACALLKSQNAPEVGVLIIPGQYAAISVPSARSASRRWAARDWPNWERSTWSCRLTRELTNAPVVRAPISTVLSSGSRSLTT